MTQSFVDDAVYRDVAAWETKVGKPYSMYFVGSVIHHEDHLFHNHSETSDVIKLAEWDSHAFGATFNGHEWFWIDDRTSCYKDSDASLDRVSYHK